MFGDINRVSLMGNVTRDPELRYTPSGAAVLSFGMATNRRYKKGEEWVDEPSFHNVVVWNSAEQLGQRVRKGTRIYIEGRLQTRSWDDKEGKQYRTEVIAERVILIARFEGDSGSAGTMNGAVTNNAVETASDKNEDDTIDPNDLPF